MEKTTKKKKKTKGLRRRIGIIAVGGLSLVMTVCLSVGATLAWFAGSTWSDENLYMGGPVYIEMAGRGHSGSTGGSGTNEAKWMGGTGSLDIKASTQRSSGTAYSKATAEGTDSNGVDYEVGDYLDAMGNKITDTAGANIQNNVLLPGQKFEIYSQARVYSTATTDTISAPEDVTTNSGSNTFNKAGNGTATHLSSKGRITTTTTSVIRARFSISIEFDPSVGFGNFTDESYMENYPVQSSPYTGDGAGQVWGDLDGEGSGTATGYVETPQAWSGALNGTAFSTTNLETPNANGLTTVHTGRRDNVADATFTGALVETTKTDTKTADLVRIQKGELKSIYSWKYVSKATYTSTALTAPKGTESALPGTADDALTQKYIAMGAPFDGSDKRSNENGYYGVWIVDETGKGIAESDAFYKARCNAYLQTYVEEFRSEYGNIETKTISSSIKSLESELNQSFVNLVNDSSDDIIAGYTNGFTVAADGSMQPVMLKDDGTAATDTNDDDVIDSQDVGASHKHNASWLYIDPSIGNDTNTNEISTATGGWWYLVASDNGGVQSQKNVIRTGSDDAVYVVNGDNPATEGETETNWTGWTKTKNTPKYVEYSAVGNDGKATVATATEETATEADHTAGVLAANGSVVATGGKYYKLTPGTNGFTRSQFAATDANRLHAMLYEVTPNAQILNEAVGKNGSKDVMKIVSHAFPFVNGTSAIPGDALTNVFANAKISFQISFQAVQAFLPYSTSIDKMTYTNPLLGTAKALTIKNAIPIFNEAFDYQENATSASISGL